MEHLICRGRSLADPFCWGGPDVPITLFDGEFPYIQYSPRIRAYLAVLNYRSMKYSIVEADIAGFVTAAFDSHPQFPYHNLTHTRSVVDHAKEIAAAYSL